MAVPLQHAEELRSRSAVSPDATAASFDRFFLTYVPRVRSLLRPYVGPGRADDLAQETLLRAFRRGLHLEADSDPWPWLARVARNLATDASRRRHLVEVSLDDDHDIPPTQTTPHTEWMAAQRREGIAAALTAIPVRSRRMLLARHVDGLPYARIAETEGVSVAVVRSALFRAKQIFRDEYDELAARRGIKVLFPLGLAGLREWLRSVREHLDRVFHRPEADAVSGVTSGLQLVQSAATAVAVGVVATAGALFPGLDEPAVVPAGDSSTTPVAMPMEAIAATDRSDPATSTSAAGSVTIAAGAEARVRDAQPLAESPDGQAADVPAPPRRVQGDVDTEATPVGDDTPVDATASADGGQKGETTGVRDRTYVAVATDESSADIDDEDGEVDTTFTTGGSVGISCASPEHQGLVTSTACGLKGAVSEE